MGFVNLFYDKKVFIDTSLFIYQIEEHSKYGNATSLFFDELETGKFSALTSVLSLMEVLVKPYHFQQPEVVSLFEDIFLNTWNLKLFSINSEIARLAAGLRSQYAVKTPDALQFATAIYHEADIFFTNDKSLKKIDKCSVVCLDDLLETT